MEANYAAPYIVAIMRDLVSLLAAEGEARAQPVDWVACQLAFQAAWEQWMAEDENPGGLCKSETFARQAFLVGWKRRHFHKASEPLSAERIRRVEGLCYPEGYRRARYGAGWTA